MNVHTPSQAGNSLKGDPGDCPVCNGSGEEPGKRKFRKGRKGPLKKQPCHKCGGSGQKAPAS